MWQTGAQTSLPVSQFSHGATARKKAKQQSSKVAPARIMAGWYHARSACDRGALGSSCPGEIDYHHAAAPRSLLAIAIDSRKLPVLQGKKGSASPTLFSPRESRVNA
jgi:hypothetical protein